MMYPAYQNYLVNIAENIMSNNVGIFQSPVAIISDMLFTDVKQRHSMAFDIVCSMTEDGHLEFNKSFDDAAKKVYEEVIQSRKAKI